eukprot:1393035-Amorphochlora_amoeboformis.AAC.1
MACEGNPNSNPNPNPNPNSNPNLSSNPNPNPNPNPYPNQAFGRWIHTVKDLVIHDDDDDMDIVGSQSDGEAVKKARRYLDSI